MDINTLERVAFCALDGEALGVALLPKDRLALVNQSGNLLLFDFSDKPKDTVTSHSKIWTIWKGGLPKDISFWLQSLHYGASIVTGSLGYEGLRQAFVWDISSRQKVWTLYCGEQSSFDTAVPAISLTNGCSVVAACRDGINIWDTRGEGESIREPRVLPQRSQCLLALANGSFASVNAKANNTITVWDATIAYHSQSRTYTASSPIKQMKLLADDSLALTCANGNVEIVPSAFVKGCMQEIAALTAAGSYKLLQDAGLAAKSAVASKTAVAAVAGTPGQSGGAAPEALVAPVSAAALQPAVADMTSVDMASPRAIDLGLASISGVSITL